MQWAAVIILLSETNVPVQSLPDEEIHATQGMLLSGISLPLTTDSWVSSVPSPQAAAMRVRDILAKMIGNFDLTLDMRDSGCIFCQPGDTIGQAILHIICG